MATGSTAEVQKLAGPSTRVIDLQGRTVIPGLIDSHLHAIRAALSFSTEVNWIGAPSLIDALGRIRDAARTMRPGAWLIVAGGWNVQQFKENRRPTQAELVAAAPNNPVYVQLGYGWSMLTPLAMKALNISSEADLPSGGRFEKDASGKLTGAVTGGQGAIIALFDKLPRPGFDDQVEGTTKFFRELNRLAVTGVVDPGGNNLTPDDYQALFKVWRDGRMTVRVAYSLCGQTPGAEFEELKSWTALLPTGFGDQMLRFNGLGERITAAMNNNDRPTESDKDRYYQIVKWAAERGMPITMHWGRDGSVDQLLTIFERVNREVPIANLRWSIAHLNDASVQSLQRMKALGVGWTVQDAMYFGGDQFVQQSGAGGGAPRAAGQYGGEDRRRRRRRHRRPPGRVVQSVHRPAMVHRRQDRRRCRDSRTGGNADPRRRPAFLHDRQRLVLARRADARFARSRQARRSRGAVQRLSDRAGRPDRRHRIAAHDGRREDRLCRGAVGEIGKLADWPVVVYRTDPFANSYLELPIWICNSLTKSRS